MAKIVFDSEKELEDMIFNQIMSHGCPFAESEVPVAMQQVDLYPYGIADIVTITGMDSTDPVLLFNIIEVKKELVTKDTLAQVCRYMRGLDNLLAHIDPGYKWKIFGTAVAPDVNKNDDTVYLCDSISNVATYTVEFDLYDGAIFEHRGGWHKEVEIIDENKPLFDAANSLSKSLTETGKAIMAAAKEADSE